jgi:hypothetical protein
MVELIQRNVDQDAQANIVDRFANELSCERFEPPVMPKRAVCQFLDQRAAARGAIVVDGSERVAEIRALQDACDRLSCQNLFVVHRR